MKGYWEKPEFFKKNIKNEHQPNILLKFSINYHRLLLTSFNLVVTICHASDIVCNISIRGIAADGR